MEIKGEWECVLACGGGIVRVDQVVKKGFGVEKVEVKVMSCREEQQDHDGCGVCVCVCVWAF